MSKGSKESEMLQLKQIINGKHDGEEQLKLLKEFETRKSLKQFKILSRISELVPLSTSLLMMKDIMSLFFRKLVTLLDEGNVLKNAELSKSVLESLKSFWSLCSRQQNIVSSSQLFGKWHPLLLEEITPLASVYIDLFISTYGHKDDRDLWSRRLYSWLNFDLPDRAIKVALLETEGHSRDGAALAGPLLSRVLQRKFDSSSNPEYLLHFLLLKKWQSLDALSDVKEASKHIKAPPSFLAWLTTYWKDSTEYIPVDTTMKRSKVSRFLLRLKTDSVLESLTDVLQMTVFPDSVEGQPISGVSSGSLLFIVDKKGDEQVDEVKTSQGEMSSENIGENKDLTENQANDDSHSTVRPGKKRTARETSESPDKRRSLEGRKSKDLDETVSSPRKKRNKLNRSEHEVDTDVFFVDRACSKWEDDKGESSSLVQFLGLSEDNVSEEEVKPGKRKRSLSREESDDGANDKENGDVEEVKSKRQKQNDETSSEGENDAEEEEEEDEVTESHSLRSRNLATAVLIKKNILISDPVASSYFASNVADTKPVQVIESPSTPRSGRVKKTQELKNASLSSPIRSSPRIRNLIAKKAADSEDGSENESPLPQKTNSTPQKLTTESPLIQKKNGSTKKGKGNESPLILTKNSTPQNKKLSSTPIKNGADSSQKRSAKKTKVTP